MLLRRFLMHHPNCHRFVMWPMNVQKLGYQEADDFMRSAQFISSALICSVIDLLDYYSRFSPFYYRLIFLLMLFFVRLYGCSYEVGALSSLIFSYGPCLLDAP